jgi:hypothetical protein
VVLDDEQASAAWRDLREFRWASEDVLVRIPLAPARVSGLSKGICAMGSRLHVSAGGNVGFVSSGDAASLDALLRQLHLEGITLRGAAPLWLGLRRTSQIASAVKEALDPHHRFPSLDD